MAIKEKPEISIEEQKSLRKAFWISFAISFAVSIGVAVGSYFLIKSGLGENPDKWRLWADTATLPAVLFIVMFLLVKLSDFGAFDAIAYAIKLVVTMTFYSNVRKTKLPASYREYRELKQGKKRVNALFLIYTALPYIALTIVFVILYFVNK